MLKVIAIVLLVFSFVTAFSTQQRSDYLIYGNMELQLKTSWGYPSPLQTYFYHSGLRYPFHMLSTANYRGHIATWEIRDEKFYLVEIRVGDSIRRPRDYKITSTFAAESAGDTVFADWFSGVLQCRELTPVYNNIDSRRMLYIHIRKGEVLDKDTLPIFDMIEGKRTPLSAMFDKYSAFYSHLSADRISFKGEDCVLMSGGVKPSPLFAYYGNDIFDWPYTWENSERSGAPNALWKIVGDTLYLEEIELRFGGRIDTVYTDMLSLQNEFPGKVRNGMVFADWTNGIYKIKHGYMTNDSGARVDEYFKVTKYTFIRLLQGVITESFTVGPDFQFDNPPDTIDPKLKALIEEYYKKYDNR